MGHPHNAGEEESQPAQPLPDEERREALGSLEGTAKPTTPQGEDKGEYLGVAEPPVDPALKLTREREKTRRFIIYYLFGLFSLVVVIPFIPPIFGRSLSDQHWEYLRVVLSALTGLLGAAIAFYFRAAGDR